MVAKIMVEVVVVVVVVAVIMKVAVVVMLLVTGCWLAVGGNVSGGDRIGERILNWRWLAAEA